MFSLEIPEESFLLLTTNKLLWRVLKMDFIKSTKLSVSICKLWTCEYMLKRSHSSFRIIFASSNIDVRQVGTLLMTSVMSSIKSL